MRRKHAFAFGSRPLIYHSRSQFDLSYRHKTTINAGDLVPFYCQEVLPGDTIKCDTRFVARVTSALLKPVMDNAFVDMYYFFIPNRLVMDNWTSVMGENKKTAWAPAVETFVPKVGISSNSSLPVASVHSIANYLGVPQSVTGTQLSDDGGVSVLPFRAYALVYDEWFRDENLIDPINISKGDVASSAEILNDGDFSSSNYCGKVAKVSKLHDMFTSSLPAPQKGSPVQVGTSVVPAHLSPVVPFTPAAGSTRLPFGVGSVAGSAADMYQLALKQGWSLPSGTTGVLREFTQFGNIFTGTSDGGGRLIGSSVAADSPGVYPLKGYVRSSDNTNNGGVADFTNLVAYSAETPLQAVNVNDLRFAFQLQKLLEKDARGGTRYTEFLREHFGVISPDARLQRTEFLGGKRVPLSVFQVAQTSQPTETSPLADVGAFSLTNGRAGFTKGFVEHGYVIGFCCVRQFHTYQQGLDKMFSRFKRTDFYDPVFSNIGEQPVYTKELYANVGSPDTVFGYQEAWYDYRARNSRISGQLNTAADEGLDIWHFGDWYTSQPVLGQEWIQEVPNYIDRTLAIKMSVSDQFIFDFYNKQVATRVLPTYSTPGLIDHH